MGTVQLNLTILLALIPTGIVLAWSVLKGLDKLAGIDFKTEIAPLLESNALAASIYFSARFVGVLYFIGQLCSRFV